MRPPVGRVTFEPMTCDVEQASKEQTGHKAVSGTTEQEPTTGPKRPSLREGGDSAFRGVESTPDSAPVDFR
jgi:hypothetical protein